jgi:hypothetical protein
MDFQLRDDCMNFKIFFFTILLIPMVSSAETQNQSAQKPKEGFVTWRKVATTTGVGGLVGMVGGFIGLMATSAALIPSVKAHIKEILPNASDKYLEDFAWENQSTLKSKSITLSIATSEGIKSVTIPPLGNSITKRYDKLDMGLFLAICAGGALAVTCLGTLTYALIKKLTSKPKNEQKSTNAVVA